MADIDPLEAEEKSIETSVAAHVEEISLIQPYPEEITMDAPRHVEVPDVMPEAPVAASAPAADPAASVPAATTDTKPAAPVASAKPKHKRFGFLQIFSKHKKTSSPAPATAADVATPIDAKAESIASEEPKKEA